MGRLRIKALLLKHVYFKDALDDHFVISFRIHFLCHCQLVARMCHDLLLYMHVHVPTPTLNKVLCYSILDIYRERLLSRIKTFNKAI